MATESNKSTRPGDAKFKTASISISSGDRAQPIVNGGTGGGGVKGGKTNEAMLKMGRSAAQAAANGKAY